MLRRNEGYNKNINRNEALEKSILMSFIIGESKIN